MAERKTYYSFHDIPFGTTQTRTTPTALSGFKFGRQEIVQILIAMAVLTIAFSFAFAPSPPLGYLGQVIANLPLAFIAIATAFFCHEMAHKYVGQRYGYWSEFRMYPLGLLIALFLGIFAGFVFAAPGAVQIFGRPTQEEEGKISMAGPTTNLLLGIVFFSIFTVSTGTVRILSFYVSYINVFLALFNLIPFGPLDGLKIFNWNKGMWGILIAICVVLFLMLLGVFG